MRQESRARITSPETMTTLYCASWVLPDFFSRPILPVRSQDPRAIALRQSITAVGSRERSFQNPPLRRDFGESAIIPGLINAHSHLELTAMRGFLEKEESRLFCLANEAYYRSPRANDCRRPLRVAARGVLVKRYAQALRALQTPAIPASKA